MSEEEVKRPLLYIERGNVHKKGLDPHRFDNLRYLVCEEELDDPVISFEEVMKKADKLLNDPYYWIRLRDVITY
jgi:hypothetical protein